MDEYLEQIAELLVNSADVPTDESDVADEACIVQTVKNALEYLAKARGENANSRATILEMGGHLNAINAMLAESPDLSFTKDDLQVWGQTVAGVGHVLRYLDGARGACVANENEIERLNNQIQRWNTGANELQDKYLAAQQEIGALTEQLSAAKRTAKRWEDEAANSQARYEGMEAALRIVLELAGVGK
jgi:DNA repair exonuclease SbcCD ATPase subunit